MSPAIEGLERPSLAKLQNHPRARHPIGAFAMNQMANHIERAPGVFTFILECPRLPVDHAEARREQRACE